MKWVEKAHQRDDSSDDERDTCMGEFVLALNKCWKE